MCWLKVLNLGGTKTFVCCCLAFAWLDLSWYVWILLCTIVCTLNTFTKQLPSLSSIPTFIFIQWQVILDQLSISTPFQKLFSADPFLKHYLSRLLFSKKPQVDNVGSSDPIQAFPYWWFQLVQPQNFVLNWFLFWGINIPP